MNKTLLKEAARVSSNKIGKNEVCLIETLIKICVLMLILAKLLKLKVT